MLMQNNVFLTPFLILCCGLLPNGIVIVTIQAEKKGTYGKLTLRNPSPQDWDFHCAGSPQARDFFVAETVAIFVGIWHS